MPKNEALKKNYFLTIEHEVGRELTPLERLAVTPIHESLRPEECPHFLTSFAHLSLTLEGEICIHCGEVLSVRPISTMRMGFRP